MPDHDLRGSAWHLAPSQYIAKRPAEHTVGKPASPYVAMPDGCQLALDVHLPDGDASKKWPTIVILTPYCRRFQVTAGSTGVEASPNTFRYRDMFVPRGYAVVVVDARGTGASFGTRDSFRSPRERQDYSTIADWIVAQPWSNGAIGATGVSYLGAACDFLASTGHPAVKAIAPLFAVWDTYADNYYPGGLLIKRLARVYDDLMVALDHDNRELRRQFVYYREPALEGPMPVDADRDGSMARSAVQEHFSNFSMPDFITDFKFRDDTLPYDPSFSTGSFSPYHYADKIPASVAVYTVSGWMDGAGYANGSISRYLSLPNAERRLLLGPWDHGARINASPWRTRPEPEFSVLSEILRFFDQHLANRATGLEREQPVHYFTVHAEEWRAAPSWPPVRDRKRFHTAAGGRLQSTPAPDQSSATHQTDFRMGTGSQTRYERIAGIDATSYYTDWPGRDGRMLNFTTAPLDQDLEMTGHPVLSLRISTSEPDAAIFVYLSEIEADGQIRYVTEGLLRALHRAEAQPPKAYQATWPWRTFARADARPMPIGEPQSMKFAMLPISWRFAKGSRIRISLAGADSDHFAQTPHGRPPRITLHSGGADGSMIELPTASPQ